MMQILTTIFDINSVAFTIMNYPMSWVELIGTLFGLWCVILTARAKVLSWPIGIVNIVFFFVLFYQIRLYSDMLLQVIFLALSVYGWYRWTHPKADEKNKDNQLKITWMESKERYLLLGIIATATFGLYLFMRKIHLIIPGLFPEAAAAPLRDSFTTIASIAAQTVMAQKKLENWLIWITVDLVALVYYFQLGVYLVGIEYVMFAMIATKGFFNWKKEV